MDKFKQNAQNVVSMMDYDPDHSFALLAQVEAYWDALRGTQILPNRSDIDPRGIEAALEYAFILERIAPGVARLRIAGSHLSDLMGMEVRGMPITSFLGSSSRRQFSDMMEELFEMPATGSVTLKSEDGNIDARMILLPLKSDMGDVSRMLGCLVTKGPLSTSPCRFNIVNTRVHPVMAISHIAPAPAPTTAPARGFAEPKAAFATPPVKSRPPYLRLVKTDK